MKTYCSSLSGSGILCSASEMKLRLENTEFFEHLGSRQRYSGRETHKNHDLKFLPRTRVRTSDSEV